MGRIPPAAKQPEKIVNLLFTNKNLLNSPPPPKGKPLGAL